MPVKVVRSDRATLSALLTSGKLTGGELSAFQQMYDDLMGGKIIDLSKKQRLWADSVYEKYKVGEIRAQVRKEARARVQTPQVFPWETNLPKKPPGRV
jgi:hypothetical protein